MITEVEGCRMRKDEIERKPDEIFGKGRHLEIATAETTNKVVERIEEIRRWKSDLKSGRK